MLAAGAVITPCVSIGGAVAGPASSATRAVTHALAVFMGRHTSLTPGSDRFKSRLLQLFLIIDYFRSLIPFFLLVVLVRVVRFNENFCAMKHRP